MQPKPFFVIPTLLMTFFGAESAAAPLCVDMAANASLVMKLEQLQGNELAPLQKLMDEYIAQASLDIEHKVNQRETLLRLFSKFDGSQHHLASELSNIPDRFSLYKGIDSARLISAFDWGNYKVAVARYQYQDQQIEEAQAFFCTESGCRISNLFERPDQPADMALRFLHQFKFNKWQGNSCPERPVDFSIAPSLGPDKHRDSLDVYISARVTSPTENDEAFALSVGHFFPCIEYARQRDANTLYQEPASGQVTDFLNQCTLGMDSGSMTPVLRGDKVTYLPPVSLILALQDARLSALAFIDLQDTRYQVLATLNGRHIGSLLVLPLSTDNSSKIDWQKYDQTLTNTMLTPEFKAFLVDKLWTDL